MKRLVLLMLLVCSISLLLSSCGTSRATVTVRNNAESTQTSIHVVTGNGGNTSVNLSPKVLSDSVRFEFSTPAPILKL